MFYLCILYPQIYEFLAYKYPERIDPHVHEMIVTANEFKSAVITQVGGGYCPVLCVSVFACIGCLSVSACLPSIRYDVR